MSNRLRRKAVRRKKEKAWRDKRRPAGKFCLHIPSDVRLVGISSWQPVAPEED